MISQFLFCYLKAIEHSQYPYLLPPYCSPYRKAWEAWIIRSKHNRNHQTHLDDTYQFDSGNKLNSIGSSRTQLSNTHKLTVLPYYEKEQFPKTVELAKLYLPLILHPCDWIVVASWIKGYEKWRIDKQLRTLISGNSNSIDLIAYQPSTSTPLVPINSSNASHFYRIIYYYYHIKRLSSSPRASYRQQYCSLILLKPQLIHSIDQALAKCSEVKQITEMTKKQIATLRSHIANNGRLPKKQQKNHKRMLINHNLNDSLRIPSLQGNYKIPGQRTILGWINSRISFHLAEIGLPYCWHYSRKTIQNSKQAINSHLILQPSDLPQEFIGKVINISLNSPGEKGGSHLLMQWNATKDKELHIRDDMGEDSQSVSDEQEEGQIRDSRRKGCLKNSRKYHIISQKQGFDSNYIVRTFHTQQITINNTQLTKINNNQEQVNSKSSIIDNKIQFNQLSDYQYQPNNTIEAINCDLLEKIQQKQLRSINNQTIFDDAIIIQPIHLQPTTISQVSQTPSSIINNPIKGHTLRQVDYSCLLQSQSQQQQQQQDLTPQFNQVQTPNWPTDQSFDQSISQSNLDQQNNGTNNNHNNHESINNNISNNNNDNNIGEPINYPIQTLQNPSISRIELKSIDLRDAMLQPIKAINLSNQIVYKQIQFSQI